MYQRSADRDDGEKQIDTKLGVVLSTESRLQFSQLYMPLMYKMGTVLLIML